MKRMFILALGLAGLLISACRPTEPRMVVVPITATPAPTDKALPRFVLIRPDGSVIQTWYGPIYRSLVEEAFIDYQSESDS